MNEFAAAVIVGCLSFLGTALTSFFANRRSNVIVEMKIDALEKEVKKHNQVLERTYKIENDIVRLDTKLTDIERGMKK